ncbi:MAG TPA: dienelactone hydrolase family protein [Bdellovibrionota bacterium]|jgi:dienelactone hydrolase
MNAEAKIVTKTVEYKDKDAVLEGFVAYDDAKKGKLPGVLVVHEWTGVGDYVKERCQQLAKLGYLAFAPDIYGKGIRPQPGKEAGELAGKYKSDRPLMRERVLAGLDELKKQVKVDPTRLAAIGYCFGGTVALELARAGADIKGVMSFHGGLSAPIPAEKNKLKAKIVVFHGAEDPAVPPDEVKAFEEEMRNAKADWALTKYANAVHAFTNPHMTGDRARPGQAEYNKDADQRSWASMQDFFREWFR